jgi:hypothetical protein
VVTLSITGVGALTKPLLGLLLRDGGERALAAQLSAVPLLGWVGARAAVSTEHTQWRRRLCAGLGLGVPVPAPAGASASAGLPASGPARGVKGRPAFHPPRGKTLACPNGPPTPLARSDTYARITSNGALLPVDASSASTPRAPFPGGYSGPGAPEGADDPARRLPPALRGLVDRLQHFDREVLMPTFTRTGVGEGQPHAAGPPPPPPAPQQQQQQQQQPHV